MWLNPYLWKVEIPIPPLFWKNTGPQLNSMNGTSLFFFFLFGITGFLGRNLLKIVKFPEDCHSYVVEVLFPQFLKVLQALLFIVAGIVVPIGMFYGVFSLIRDKFRERTIEVEEAENRGFFFGSEANYVNDVKNYGVFSEDNVPLGLRVVMGQVTLDEYLEIRNKFRH